MATSNSPDTDRRAAGLRKDGKRTMQRARLRGIGKMRKLDLTAFTQRLAAMLDAGLPLVQCMDALSDQTATPEFKAVVRDIGLRIEGGDSFAEALERYHELFGDLYVSMIRSGEMGGGLAEVTGRLAVYLEKSQKMVRKVKSAMTYPVMVLGMALILTTAMILFIVPVFKRIFDDFGAKLPAPTQFLITVSDTIKHQSLIIIVVLGGIIYALRKYLATDQGTMVFHRYVLKAPLAGPIIEKVAIARMSRTWASMLRSGVPILKCIEIGSTATGNRFLGSLLKNAGAKVENGQPLSRAIQESGVGFRFPPMLIHMVSAGEKTGNVDGMLEKVADFYEDEVEKSLESLASMIEPLLMGFLGVTVGGIVICMFLPIFKMHEIVNN